MSKHTPGPWAYQEDSDAYTHIVRGPNNRFICQLAQVTSAEIEANARLIAAAPELLEALERILKGALSLPRFAEELARAAIAKATGGAQ
ncbi:hypothetical protein [Stenotrophomonas maltophilia]|uniref:Uncharacterized protein n=1 Tax=Stenotrophomonas maltophilia TaxID=40324 RepID=A0AAJ2MZT6_STEMA|nr:hypothetical protein [Stenotrophomonas maltophilia]MDT3468959.1 hypothetical protein [Stenotrophomonas maltophilia]